MSLETVTLKLPHRLLKDAGRIASAQDVTIGHLVRVLLAKEVMRRLDPRTSSRADAGLVAALQALLARDMAEATGWDDLADRLAIQGYALRPSGGGLALFKISCGTRLCKGSELGFSYRALIVRFGGPMPGHPHGDLGLRPDSTPEFGHRLKAAQKDRIQRSLEPIFEASESWEHLINRLKRCGYVMRPFGGALALYIAGETTPICDTENVGFRYDELIKRFGGEMPNLPEGGGIRAAADKNSAASSDTAELDFDVIERASSEAQGISPS